MGRKASLICLALGVLLISSFLVIDGFDGLKFVKSASAVAPYIPPGPDFDGDGDTDISIFRPSNGYWYVRDGGSYTATWWGNPTDIPVPGDYDGDGDTDYAVIRPASSTWFVRDPAITQVYYAAGDFPLPARDTDGDGDPWQ